MNNKIPCNRLFNSRLNSIPRINKTKPKLCGGNNQYWCRRHSPDAVFDTKELRMMYTITVLKKNQRVKYINYLFSIYVYDNRL